MKRGLWLPWLAAAAYAWAIATVFGFGIWAHGF